MNCSRVLTAFVTASLFFLTFCTKPDPFGNDLFEEQTSLNFTDTLTLKASIVREDSIITSNLSAGTNLCGVLSSPIFGKTDATIYTLFRPSRSNFKFGTSLICDSVKLYLNYDAPNFYGDTTAMQTLEVWRLKDVIKPDSVYFSNASVAPLYKIGEQTFFPKPNTRRKLRDTSGVTLQGDSIGAFVTIPLDADFGQKILNLDSISLGTAAEFGKKMLGLQFRVTTPGGTPAMMSFDLNKLAFSRITLFYKANSSLTTKTFHFYFVNTNKWTNITHDYAGSEVENLINKSADSILFLQASSGLKIKFEVPNIKNFKNLVINQAELELSLLDFPNDNVVLYPSAKQLLMTYSDTISKNNKFPFIQDILYSAGSGLTGSLAGFGGSLKKEASGKKYRLNLSDHLQDMISGKRPSIFYVNIFPQDFSAVRTMVVSPDSKSIYRAKLRVKTSKI